MAGLRPQVIVEVELAGSGGGWTNLGEGGSGDVVAAEGLAIHRGIQGGGPDDNVAETGTLSFTLDNAASNSAHLLGYYSLYNANKRAGWALDIGCRVRLVDPATSTSWTRFVGKVDAISPSSGQHGDRRARVTAVDWMDDAARWAITATVGAQVGKRWDEILAAILAQMPTAPAGGSSLEAGVETYPYAMDTSAFSAQEALAEFKKLADSERGLIYIKADGTLKAEGRHTRLTNLSVVWTLTNAELIGLTLPSTRAEIIDTVRVTIHPKLVDASPTTIVYDQANVITIDAGASQLLLGPFRDPVTGDTMGATDIQALVSGSDWLANSAADGSGTNLTGSFTVTMTKGASGLSFTVTNGAAVTGYLSSLAVRGRGVRDKATLQLQAPTTTGNHVYPIDMPYQDDADTGQGAANFYQLRYGTAYAQARTVSTIGRTSALVTAMLQREISDRITIQETVTGLSNDFFINGIDEQILQTGHLQATYILAPAQDPYSGLVWILGSSVLGTNTLPADF